jgi:TRAP-type C4-dicarboxylate transport system permease small subunit
MKTDDIHAPRLFGKIAGAIEGLLATALIISVLVCFASVMGRYVFGYSHPASEEVQVYLMVAVAFLGAPVIAVREAHLRMDVMVQGFSERVRYWMHMLELLLTIATGALVTWFSFDFVSQMYALGAKSGSGTVPLWIPQAAVTVGFGLMAIVACQQFMARLLRRNGTPAAVASNPARS